MVMFTKFSRGDTSPRALAEKPLRCPQTAPREGAGMNAMATLQILFGSVICMTTALTFVELRRLRKKLQ